MHTNIITQTIVNIIVGYDPSKIICMDNIIIKNRSNLNHIHQFMQLLKQDTFGGGRRFTLKDSNLCLKQSYSFRCLLPGFSNVYDIFITSYIAEKFEEHQIFKRFCLVLRTFTSHELQKVLLSAPYFYIPRASDTNPPTTSTVYIYMAQSCLLHLCFQ